MDLYTIGCTIEPPIVWCIQKCMLIWKICFYFSFVFAICSSKMKTRHVTCGLFTEKVLRCWDNFNSHDPFIHDREGQKVVEYVLEYKMKLRSKFRITKIQRNASSVIVCERIAPVEIVPAREHLFHE